MEYRTLGRSGCRRLDARAGHDDLRQRDATRRARTRSSTRSSRPAARSSTPPTSTRAARPRRSSGAGSPRHRRRSATRSCSRPRDASRWATAPTTSVLSRRHLRRALDASLRRLGVDHIDLYQVHAWDPVTPLEETLRFLDDAVRAGQGPLCRAVELHRLAAAEGVRPRRPSAAWAPRSRCSRSTTCWSARSSGRSSRPARRTASGLLPWSPLGGGWLTGKYREGRTADRRDPARREPGPWRRGVRPSLAQTRTWDVVDAVRAVAEARGATMAQVALAWLADRPAVTSVILGARTPRAARRQPRRGRAAPDRRGDRAARRGERPAAGRLPVRRPGRRAARPSLSRRGPAWTDVRQAPGAGADLAGNV